MIINAFFSDQSICRIIKSEEDIDSDINIFSGEIIKRSFYGSYYKIDVKCMDTVITLYDYYPFNTGNSEKIKFTVEADKIICFS